MHCPTHLGFLLVVILVYHIDCLLDISEHNVAMAVVRLVDVSHFS